MTERLSADVAAANATLAAVEARLAERLGPVDVPAPGRADAMRARLAELERRRSAC